MGTRTNIAPPDVTIENLERVISGELHPFDFDGSNLVDRRVEAHDESMAILTNSRGRTPLADEQRRMNANDKLVGLIDRVLARHNDEYKRQNAPRLRREAEAAAIRAAHPEIYGDQGAPTGNVFGRALRDAIDEVRAGKATAFVDYPMPSNIRALTEAGSPGAGVPIEIKDPVMTLAASSVVMSLPGIRIEPMTSDRATYPRIGGATADGTAEGATLTAANTQTDSVSVTAQKFSIYEELTSELVEDYSTSALAVFGENMLKRLALRVDLGLFEGDGANDIIGMRNAPGANSTSVAATPTNFAKFRDAEYELLADNGEPVVWVMHPRTWKTLGAIKTGLTSDETTLLEPNPQQGPKTLLGYPVRFSTQITLTEGAGAGSWAALLDTAQLIVCERRPARLEVSRDFKFDEDVIAVRATWRGALAVLNAEAISLTTDVRA